MLTSLWQLLLHEECLPPASEYLWTETKERYVHQFQFGQTCVKTQSQIHVISHNNIVVRSLTHSCSTNKTMPPVCVVELRDIVKYEKYWVLHNHKTYLLTPWSRVLLEKLTGSAASQEIPCIFWTRRFLTVLTTVRHLSLSWAKSIQSPQPPLTSWRSILILSSHLRLGLPNCEYFLTWVFTGRCC
jgi:hypothetical protein